MKIENKIPAPEFSYTVSDTCGSIPLNYSDEIRNAVEQKSKIYFAVKRIFDFVASLAAIVFLSWVFIIVAAAIFIEDRHSPFFIQRRATKDGKEFNMIKFRSMYIDAEKRLKDLQDENEADGPVFKIRNDPRITKVGRFIRKTSIDELPQLFNVLAGTMSVVGPRPPLPREVNEYSSDQFDRLAVKGGLTCFWQVSGRSKIGFDEWVELDRRYIREMSVATDLKIIFMTVKAVVTCDGAM